jgi:hypothetical protein
MAVATIEPALEGVPVGVMMPGPVSDSFDPEFGTSANAQDVRDVIEAVRDKVCSSLPAALRNIVELAHEGPKGKPHAVTLTENELRVIRFALNRALESI